jgi:transposase InsO family protein
MEPGMKNTVVVRIGTRVVHDHEEWTVCAIMGTEICLERRGGARGVARVRTVSLLDPHGAYRIIDRIPNTGTESKPPLPSDMALQLIPDDQLDKVLERASHVMEILRGYRSGTKEQALPGEPKAPYRPGNGRMSKYKAKAEELGVSIPAVRGWVKRYEQDGVLGLLDGRKQKPIDPYHGCSAEWVKVARVVVEERTAKSNITKKGLLRIIEARLRKDAKNLTTAGQEGESEPIAVTMPGPSAAYRALNELTRDKDTFGTAPHRRERADVPRDGFGRFYASCPGELVLMDTNRLDVWALDGITLKWVQTELTVAMDLYSRCILGLRLSAVSTKSTEVASVLFEVFQPREAPPGWPDSATWPYHGVPNTVLILDKDDVLRFQGPGLLPDAVTFDHGKVYISAHITNACEELGISLQPARKYTATDKAPLERFFLTLRTGLLDLLPGYKGESPQAKGIGIEDEVVYSVSQLEEIIREWVGLVYHRSVLDALSDEQLPGLRLSPLDRYAHGIAAAGEIVLPRDPELAMRLLPVAHRVIGKDGIHFKGLVYKGRILSKYRDHQSPFRNSPGGTWPFRWNPGDLRQIYFQDPSDRSWHKLLSPTASRVRRAFNSDALDIAKRLAWQKHIDVEEALLHLLEEFGAGIELNPQQQKAALRAAQKDARFQAEVKRIEAEAEANDESPDERDEDLVEDFDEGLTGDESGRREQTDDTYYDDAAGLA